MKNKKSLVSTLIGSVVTIIFFLIFLRYTGLYDPFIKGLRYLPDFFKDISNSLKEGFK